MKLLAPSLLAALLAASCRQDMHDNPRLEAMEASAFFPDGRSLRPLVPGTVARGRLEEDELLERGTLGGQLAATFPFAILRADLERGRERYEIFCTPCHDATGSGNGRVVQRGFQRSPSLHEQRLRDASAGYLFDVITRGFGGMYDLADRIEPADRWRIVAWMRVLQRSQHATVADVPIYERARLEAEGR